MADTNEDPYAGAETEEERQAIYQKLLTEYETSELTRREEVYNDFMSDWKLQRDIQRDIDQRGHKALLTVSAGSFGVSFAFISQLVPLDLATDMPILITAWACFAATILLAILELKIGSLVQDMLLDSIEENIKRGYEGKSYLVPKRWAIIWPERILSWLSVVTFATGVICLLYFVLVNTMFM